MAEFRGTIFECIELDSPSTDTNASPPSISTDLISTMTKCLCSVSTFSELSKNPDLPSSLFAQPHPSTNKTRSSFDWLHKAQIEKKLVSIDIEGARLNRVSCIGLSTHPLKPSLSLSQIGISLLKSKSCGPSASLMSDSTVPKVLQNALYDWLSFSLAVAVPYPQHPTRHHAFWLGALPRTS